MLTLDWSVLRLFSALLTASTLPCTSVLMMRLSAFTSPAAMRVWTSSRVGPVERFICDSRMRRSTSWRAARSSVVTSKMSPASGTPLMPKTSTGCDGAAAVMGCPLSVSIARMRPFILPTTTLSPTLRVPD